jgi:large conductance mechanosensitive channel
MPIIGAVVGKPSFDDLTLGIGDGVIRYGSFLTLLVNFLIIAFVLFVIVQAAEKLQNMRSQADKEEDPSELDVLTEIRDLLRQQRSA